jgi:hypothetical protein
MSTSPLETTLSNSTLRNSTLRKSGLAAAAASALIAVGMPLAFAAPTAAPPSDSEGYVNSTARCSSPDTAVLFGTTQSSRVAICKTADGAFEYRGVRVSDGAKLIAPAKQTSTSTFVVNNDGVKYTITPTALSVTANGDTFRTETWSDFHGPEAPAASSSTPSAGSTSPSKATSPATSPASATAKPSTSAAATPSTSAPAASSAVPLPPLPAEVGGGSSSVE